MATTRRRKTPSWITTVADEIEVVLPRNLQAAKKLLDAVEGFVDDNVDLNAGHILTLLPPTPFKARKILRVVRERRGIPDR